MTLAVLVGGVVVLLVVGQRRGRFIVAAVAATMALAVLWLVAAVLTATRWHDADGWVDCYPSCTLLQDAVGIILVYGLGLLVLLVLVAVAAAVAARVLASRR